MQIPGHQEGAESAAPLLLRPPQVPRPLPRELGLWQHAFPVASVVRLGVAPQEKKDPLSQRNRLAPLRSAHLSAATPVHSEAQSESRGQRVQPLHSDGPKSGCLGRNCLFLIAGAQGWAQKTLGVLPQRGGRTEGQQSIFFVLGSPRRAWADPFLSQVLPAPKA